MGLHGFPVHNISIFQLPKYLDAYIIFRMTTQVEMVSNSGTSVISYIRDVLAATGVKGASSLSHIKNITFATSKYVDKVGI